MAYCDVCGNFDDEHTDGEPEIKALEGYQPTLYYYWDGSFCEEDYDWRRKFPDVDCMCEICFDIANRESKIDWVNGDPFRAGYPTHRQTVPIILVSQDPQHGSFFMS